MDEFLVIATGWIGCHFLKENIRSGCSLGDTLNMGILGLPGR